MFETIARLNIARLRKRLVEESDETTRQILLRLLSEEEARLAALEDPPTGKRFTAASGQEHPYDE